VVIDYNILWILSREKCWLCPALFASKTDLHKHLTSSEHRCAAVVCPWCRGVKKTFLRVGDLSQHVKGAHPDLNIARSRFSRASGFYFATDPANYARVAERITSYDEEDAYQNRKAVRCWAESFPNRKDIAEKWNTGWKEGEEIAKRKANRTPEEGHPRTSKRKRGGSENSGEMLDLSSFDDDVSLGVDADEQIGSDPTSTAGIEERTREQSKDRRVVEVSGGAKDGMDKDRGREEGKGEERSVEKRGGTSVTQASAERTEKAGERDDQVRNSTPAPNKTQKEGKVTNGDEDDRSDDMSCSSYSSSSTSSLEESTLNIKTRAFKLLTRGVMPICPPARRDWGNGGSITFVRGAINLVWPPPNWRQLSADQRLLAHEHAAIMLEQSNEGVFPILSRRTLLDKYNFLSLDGANKTQEEENQGDKIDAKIRQYNSAYLRAIVKGEIKDSRVSWGVVRSIERAERWRDVDEVLDALDNKEIKIKI